MSDFKVLYFKRNANETRKVTVLNGYYRVNGGKRHTDLLSYLTEIAAKGWESTDFYGYMRAKSI